MNASPFPVLQVNSPESPLLRLLRMPAGSRIHSRNLHDNMSSSLTSAPRDHFPDNLPTHVPLPQATFLMESQARADHARRNTCKKFQGDFFEDMTLEINLEA